MNQVSSISQTSVPAASVSSSAGKNILTQADFLKLFTKQLQYQDPMNPMDNYQMANQMAQFNMVQAMTDMKESVKNLESYQASANSLQMAGLIGKKAETSGSNISISQGNLSEGYYQLNKSGKVAIQIFDSQGNLVRALNAGMKDSSKQRLIWDGKNQQGTALPDGIYTFQVSAIDESGQSIPVKTSKVGTITGISFEEGTSYLKMGLDKIAINEIISILA
jgi:flagellar basal-body rod modification protein FlgD